MPHTVEQIVVEAQELSPEEVRRLVMTLTTWLTDHAEERLNTARRRLYQQAARLIGGFRDRADVTHLAADHDDYLIAISKMRASGGLARDERQSKGD